MISCLMHYWQKYMYTHASYPTQVQNTWTSQILAHNYSFSILLLYPYTSSSASAVAKRTSHFLSTCTASSHARHTLAVLTADYSPCSCELLLALSRRRGRALWFRHRHFPLSKAKISQRLSPVSAQHSDLARSHDDTAG